MWAQPNVYHVRIVLKSKRTVCQYQSSRFKMLRRFQFVFLFTWQSALHLAISNLPDHQEIITAFDPMSLHYEGPIFG